MGQAYPLVYVFSRPPLLEALRPCVPFPIDPSLSLEYRSQRLVGSRGAIELPTRLSPHSSRTPDDGSIPHQTCQLHHSFGQSSRVGLSQRPFAPGGLGLCRMNTEAHWEGSLNHQVPTPSHTLLELELINVLFFHTPST